MIMDIIVLYLFKVTLYIESWIPPTKCYDWILIEDTFMNFQYNTLFPLQQKSCILNWINQIWFGQTQLNPIILHVVDELRDYI